MSDRELSIEETKEIINQYRDTMAELETHTSFLEMSQSMKKIVGADYLPCDYPQYLIVGFIDVNTDKYFGIRISNLKKLEEFTKAQQDTIRKCLATHEGKIALAVSLSDNKTILKKNKQVNDKKI